MIRWTELPTSIAAQLHHQRSIGCMQKRKPAVGEASHQNRGQEGRRDLNGAPGVAIPPAAKLTTGSRFKRAVSLSRWNGAWISLAYVYNSSSVITLALRISPAMARWWRTASTTFPVPASPLV